MNNINSIVKYDKFASGQAAVKLKLDVVTPVAAKWILQSLTGRQSAEIEYYLQNYSGFACELYFSIALVHHCY